MKKFLIALMVLAMSLSVFSSFGFGPPNREWEANPPIHARPEVTPKYVNGYAPVQIGKAYGFNQLTGNGTGKTIAIVDAYGSSTVQNDLAVFSQQFGLPSANLAIAYPQGKPGPNSGWALETSLDVEWAHAIAPGANILLVVAKSSSLSNLLGAVDYATAHGASVVSMSWGGSEFSGESSYDSHFSNSNITYLASSGDSGAGVEWPAVSPKVVGVGGTTLNTQSDGTYVGEAAWSGSGGGQSAYETEPSYQNVVQSSGQRQVPDVAFVADPATGVAVYDSTRYNGQKGWFVVGGTSVGAPCWAGLFALAAQSGDAGLYTLASTSYSGNYHDITTGDSRAVTGYDLVTGLGSPIANAIVSGLGGK